MEYILFSQEDEPFDLAPIETMLVNCSPPELKLAEKVLQLFLLRSDLKTQKRRRPQVFFTKWHFSSETK